MECRNYGILFVERITNGHKPQPTYGGVPVHKPALSFTVPPLFRSKTLIFKCVTEEVEATEKISSMQAMCQNTLFRIISQL